MLQPVTFHSQPVFNIFSDLLKITTKWFLVCVTLFNYRKASSNDGIFAAAGIPAGKIEITRVTWWMPRILPSDFEGYRLTKMLEKETTLQVGFRRRQCAIVSLPVNNTSYTWNLGVKRERPTFIIVGLQTGKGDNQQHNPALFNH